MYFECFFLYPEGKNKPDNLSDRIAVQFGTEWRRYRVIVDWVEFMFSCYHGESDYRLDEIYLYTNPELWSRTEIVVPATVAGDAFSNLWSPKRNMEPYRSGPKWKSPATWNDAASSSNSRRVNRRRPGPESPTARSSPKPGRAN